MSDVDEEDDQEGGGLEDEDEDEETLRLQLQAIEAKLKLKKLQAKKRQSSSQPQSEDASSSVAASPRKRVSRADLLPGVQVPVSPIKDRFPAPEPSKQHTSPARVLLGIDKGLKARDVSLKRARNGTQLPKSGTPSSQPKQSFSERIAATRLSNEEQEAKQDRIRKARSAGFSIPAPPISTPASRPSQTPDLSSRTQPAVPIFRRPHTSFDSNTTSDSPFVSASAERSTPASALPPSKRFSTIDGDDEGKSTEPSEEDGSCFESYSALHLSRRHILHTDLVRSLEDKELYTLPRLLKEVTAPHYDAPDCESDYVVFAIIASKSSPYETKTKPPVNSSGPDPADEINPRNKFMVLTLTDLKWELDLFLFDTAFTQFWKLTPGTLIAILNPSIMPPKTKQHSGRFSLKLSSSDDGIIEIGAARDLAFCKSIKKDGRECGGWINARKTQFCDFHVELALEKTRKHRMETNSMYRPPTAARETFGAGARFKPNSRARDAARAERKPPPPGQFRDAEAGQYYMGGRSGFSAASLLDAEDVGRADAMRKRLQAREKERLLGEKLARLGNGAGAEYLAATTASNTATANAADNDAGSEKTRSDTAAMARERDGTADDELNPDALSLLASTKGKAATVDLRSLKTRKRAFDGSATSSSTPTATSSSTPSAGTKSEPMGWGGANRRALPYPGRDPPVSALKSPEKGQTRLGFGAAAAAAAATGGAAGAASKQEKDTREGPGSREESPRKRARFALEGKEGIREPGRDSLSLNAGGGGGLGLNVGGGLGQAIKKRQGRRQVVEMAPESSDDDLDIV